MPAKKGSKSYNHHHSFLGENSKNLKTISFNDTKLQNQKLFIVEQEKEIHSLEMRIKRKHEKICDMNSENEHLRIPDRSVISQKCKKFRLSNPSSTDLNLKAKSVRRRETFNACESIHGGSKDNKDPILWGDGRDFDC